MGVLFGFCERDVRDATGVQLQHADLDGVVDEGGRAARELRFVGDEREEHADREATVEDEMCAQPDDGDVGHAEQGPAECAEDHPQFFHPDAGIERVDDKVLVRRAPLQFAVEQFHCLHAAHRLEEVRLLLRGADDLVERGLAQRAVSKDAQDRVHGRHAAHQHRELPAVDEHHERRDHGHHAVHDHFEHGRGDGAPDGAERLEP